MNARDIFTAALERGDPAERAKYLDGACGADAKLRARVEELLAEHKQMGSFLESLPYTLQFDAAPNLALASLLVPGGQIGPYKLLQQIGEGGMGVVFLAEQKTPVKRRVALKVIKPGMDTRQVIARFEAERQALALMDHPNIAQVFDAATTPEGLPYFVMEFVKGVPINEYCDQQQASLRERLQLLQSVCNAVQHAHGKGIIHRDLKPNNILVSPHDGVPVVKVIDFGVAKAIGQQLTEKTVFTQVAQLIGTPLYMSPEQAELNALDVDIRTDVYSLGVVLYELLTGTTPIDNERLKRAAFDEMRRIIREEEPPRPSMRISSLGEKLALISKQRQIDVARLPGLLRGDPDWIVMKALEKDRKRRYETASAFAADIGRYLGELPIEARPPSAGYRLQKFVRRNRGVVVSAALVLLSLFAGLATSIAWAVRAQHAEDKQRATSGRLRNALDDAVEQRRIAQRETSTARAAREETRDAFYAASMNLVQNAYDRGDLRRADDILSHHIPKPGERDLRGFEWWFWRRLFHPPYEVLGPGEPMMQSGRVSGETLFNPNGDSIVTVNNTRADTRQPAPESSEIRVWSISEQKYVWRFTQRPVITGAMTSTFDPSGGKLAFMWFADPHHRLSHQEHRDSGRLLVLDLANRRQVLFEQGPFGDDACAFSEDGRLLATGQLGPYDFPFGVQMLSEQSIAKAQRSAVNPRVNADPFRPKLDEPAPSPIDAEPTFPIAIWDCQTGLKMKTLMGRGRSQAAVFRENQLLSLEVNGSNNSNDSTRVVFHLTIWDVARGEQIVRRELPGGRFEFHLKSKAILHSQHWLDADEFGNRIVSLDPDDEEYVAGESQLPPEDDGLAGGDEGGLAVGYSRVSRPPATFDAPSQYVRFYDRALNQSPAQLLTVDPVGIAAYQERAGYLVAKATDGRLRRYRLRPEQANGKLAETPGYWIASPTRHRWLRVATSGEAPQLFDAWGDSIIQFEREDQSPLVAAAFTKNRSSPSMKRATSIAGMQKAAALKTASARRN